jgi:hypothetical protein
MLSDSAVRHIEFSTNARLSRLGLRPNWRLTKQAFADLAATEFQGAPAHLHNAVTELTAGHNADSIREGINLAESVVRVLEPRGDFAKALSRLDAKIKIHEAMKIGFTKLYGFTSDVAAADRTVQPMYRLRSDEPQADQHQYAGQDGEQEAI